MTSASSLLEQVKKNLGLPVGNKTEAGNRDYLDAAPFVALYAKNERIYRIADWMAPMDQRGPSTTSKGKPSATSSTQPEEEDWTTSLAEPSRPAGGQKRSAIKPSFKGILPPKGTAVKGGPTKSAAPKAFHATSAKKLGWGQRGSERQRNRETSVRIESSWNLMEEIEFSRISKLQFDPDVPELLTSVGSVKFYNKTLDKLTTKAEKTVTIEDVPVNRYLQLSDDPVIKKMAADKVANVFMTDIVAALLMSAPRTVFPWDLCVKKDESGTIFIDKREDSHVDYTLVGETSVDPPSDEKEQFNSSVNLSIEATRLNNVIPQIISTDETVEFVPSSEYSGVEKRTSFTGHAYKYFKWNMGDEMTFVIRSEVNGMTRLANAEKSVLTKALLEYDYKGSGTLDWRIKLDNQRGAVLANEIKNNNAVFARWIFQAILAQVDLIKISYVSRVTPKDRVRHVLLGLQELEPEELATQMNLDTHNGFGILKALADLIKSLPVQDVVLIRDPAKPVLRLYNTAA